MGLHALAEEEGVERLVGLGLPLRFDWDLSFLLDVKQACFFVQGEDDEFGSPAELDAFATRMSAPVEISIIPGASHLFSAVEDRAVDSVVGHLARHYPANP